MEARDRIKTNMKSQSTHRWDGSMATLEQIRDVARRIGEEFSPQRVILFGSYAYGKPTRDSDVDLLVITPFKGRSVEKSVEIRLKIRPPFPVDLLVRTPQKVQERLAMGDCFMREILTKGKVLYEAAHA
jgi:predicted nucleotidyltransferase